MNKNNKYQFAVGIPSLNEADSIPFVLRQVDKGLSCHFGPTKCIILNLDSNSSDKTVESFLKVKTKCYKQSIKVPSGKGRAMLWFFRYCLNHNIPNIATVDADLRTITPNWVYQLLKPISKGYDYVIPVYTRNRFEANITNHFAYPLILATYGIKLRQPLGGEFGYSQKFCRYLLETPKYQKVYQYGIDIFISCCAVAGGFKIFETYLGKKIHAPSFYHMESTFRQVSESGIYTTKICRSKKSTSDIKYDNHASGIDSYQYFPHKKAIPLLMQQLKRRYLLYEKKGLYERYISNKKLIKKLGLIISRKNTSLLDEYIWTDYLVELMRTCWKRRFDVGKLKVISRITIPIYRWRAITYWFAVENRSPQEAENMLIKQANLLQKGLHTQN